MVTNVSVLIEEDTVDVIEKIEYVESAKVISDVNDIEEDVIRYASVELVFLSELSHYESVFRSISHEPLYILYCRLMLEHSFFS